MDRKETVLAIPDEVIMSKIYFIRGYKVMLDRDLASLYNVETRRLNEQVKRNINRFPPDFMFQLNAVEQESLMSQIATSKRGGIRKLLYCFTEHGVLMLSSVLNSEKAINVNIKIMRIFVRFRKLLTENTELRLAIEKLEKKTDNNSKNIELVFRYLDELIEKKESKKEYAAVGYKIPPRN